MAVRALTEGYVRKGGHNAFPSQITERPPAPGPIYQRNSPRSTRLTHTYAELEVSAAAFDEIKAKLVEAGYDHAFVDSAIDMHGIGLTRGAEKFTAPDHDPA